MNEHEKAVRAARQVAAITGFYVHLAVYVLVMAILLAVDATGGTGWWVHWPALGWGIGVLAHGLAVLGRTPPLITQWQLRKIREIRDRM